MHLIKLSTKNYNGRYIIYCPYCQADQFGVPGEAIYRHPCPQAGMLYFLNDYCIVGAPNYMDEEQSNTNNRR